MQIREFKKFFNQTHKLFFILSVLLSFISVHEGFFYYKAFFGLTVAILASITFEVLRLSSLFGMFRAPSYARLVSFLLYAFSAFVCFFASYSSFYSQIAESYQIDVKALAESRRKEIELIKKAQAKARIKALEKLERDINWCRIKLAKSPQSEYWKNRLAQLLEQRELTAAFYDSILSYIPGSDIESWIAREAAKYDISGINSGGNKGMARTLSESVMRIWGIGEASAKRLSAISIALGIELGIFLLAMLSHAFSAQSASPKVLKPLVKKYGMEAVSGFICAYKSYYSRNKRLPGAKDLSKLHREIRKAVLADSKLQEELISIVTDEHES